ncbi:hypothetical protein ACWOAH_09440 [Vagococcus vulneris]|uniref:Gram-positive cocci surface proteins LPxTG domain-containing protein n=1 Tax=Vagococcus vulneris TaxID=1977869 RepID=A0A429ZUK1_9ENTE|nr:hypothetical protein [Vagococcus vulneris]RST97354.1 hypothetical protein CBF37_09740 [Vagococcus vulneris]
MKKLFSLLLVSLLAVIFASSASANTAKGGAILDELNAGVTTDAGTFYLPQQFITQAENELKANNYTDSQVDQVVANIRAAKQLVIDNSKGLKANSLSELMNQLPQNVMDQIWSYVTKSANVLGLSIDQKGNILSRDGKAIITTNTKNQPVVKATGANYTTALALLSTLVLGSIGSAVVLKRRAVA